MRAEDVGFGHSHGFSFASLIKSHSPDPVSLGPKGPRDLLSKSHILALTHAKATLLGLLLVFAEDVGISVVTRPVYLLAILFASSKIPQKLFESQRKTH
jgi:hypothetical protein